MQVSILNLLINRTERLRVVDGTVPAITGKQLATRALGESDGAPQNVHEFGGVGLMIGDRPVSEQTQLAGSEDTASGARVSSASSSPPRRRSRPNYSRAASPSRVREK